jgi:hypothetical protein
MALFSTEMAAFFKRFILQYDASHPKDINKYQEPTPQKGFASTPKKG